MGRGRERELADGSAAACAIVGRLSVSYPRRQQLRRFRGAGGRGLRAAIAAGAAVGLARLELWWPAATMTVIATAAALAARRQRCGSPHAALSAPARRHRSEPRWRRSNVKAGMFSTASRGRRGDLDHLVRSPTGRGFVIETKTRRYSAADITQTAGEARRLERRRRQFPLGVQAVLCVVREPWRSERNGDAILVSLSSLAAVLRSDAYACEHTADRRGGDTARSPRTARMP